ncbi:MAG: hypothetical protein KDB48_01365, partial [Solirubrobacterales bacterium]|nr:hypothetical protein [Solirubrobacterales bacterium]
NESREEIGEKGLTLIAISLGNLEAADTVQMELPLDQGPGPARESPALDRAVDDVRSRFGDDVINRASMIDADQGSPVPVLPD